MKTLISLLLAIAVVAVALPAQMIAQEKSSIYTPLKIVNNKAATKTSSETALFKNWASPNSWNPIDTTEAFSLSNLMPGDTLLIPVFSSTAARYYGALKVQFGYTGSGNLLWRPPITLDSAKRVGSAIAALVSSTADSIIVARSVWWRRVGKGEAGATHARVIFGKDTTNTPNSATAVYRLGIISDYRNKK